MKTNFKSYKVVQEGRNCSGFAGGSRLWCLVDRIGDLFDDQQVFLANQISRQIKQIEQTVTVHIVGGGFLGRYAEALVLLVTHLIDETVLINITRKFG